MTSNQVPWQRPLAGCVVLVGSILLAFGNDDTWDGHQDRGEEQRVLCALQGGLMATRASLIEELDDNLESGSEYGDVSGSL